MAAMAVLKIRNLDGTVKRRLQARAARHGRSLEAEARVILAEAVREPADSVGLFTTLLDRFGALGGVDLAVPGPEADRAAEFLWPRLASPRSTGKARLGLMRDRPTSLGP